MYQSDIVAAEYIQKQFKKVYTAQELAIEELVALIVGVGLEHAMWWVQQGIQPTTPTPLNFKEKEQVYLQSVFILNCTHRMCHSVLSN